MVAPAAFFTRPSPTSALLHFEGTPAPSSRSVNGHFAAALPLVTRPSAPIAYFSMTVARFVASDSPTWKPITRPVGMGFALLPLPFALVEALWTL